jgi:class 3 adenylate cyclase
VNDDPKQLRQLLQLRDLIDDAVEGSLQARRSLPDAMAHILPIVVRALDARAAFVHTYSEELALSTFQHPKYGDIQELGAIISRAQAGVEPFALDEEDAVIVAQPLDVAGEYFGCAGLVFGAERRFDRDFLLEALHIFCEETDNFFFSVRAAREKHLLMMDLGEALRDRVLAEGIRHAVGVLAKAMPLDRLLLACVGEDRSSRIQVQLFQAAELVVDTMGSLPSAPEHPQIREEARAYLDRRDPRLIKRFNFLGAREEVLINGITEAVVVGKILATSKQGTFNTFDRELLGAFGEFIRQRIVDFDKEWRSLACAFREDDVARLLQAEDYAKRYLSPREKEVAILYSDISGFTRLSEQVLKSPSAVADLVEAWSRDAVDLVWQHRGVFDKMVGDCVIALFGPPFYDRSPAECATDAIRCARAIRDMTAHFGSRSEFKHIGEGGLAVSSGVNLAALFVGRFGPNNAFTGFSSGMNNTARLQACADRGEILVMSSLVGRLPGTHGFTFGAERAAKVKNVAEPLRFRGLIAEVESPKAVDPQEASAEQALIREIALIAPRGFRPSDWAERLMNFDESAELGADLVYVKYIKGQKVLVVRAELLDPRHSNKKARIGVFSQVISFAKENGHKLVADARLEADDPTLFAAVTTFLQARSMKLGVE